MRWILYSQIILKLTFIAKIRIQGLVGFMKSWIGTVLAQIHLTYLKRSEPYEEIKIGVRPAVCIIPYVRIDRARLRSSTKVLYYDENRPEKLFYAATVRL